MKCLICSLFSFISYPSLKKFVFKSFNKYSESLTYARLSFSNEQTDKTPCPCGAFVHMGETSNE